jgi:hypothetical protein
MPACSASCFQSLECLNLDLIDQLSTKSTKEELDFMLSCGLPNEETKLKKEIVDSKTKIERNDQLTEEPSAKHDELMKEVHVEDAQIEDIAGKTAYHCDQKGATTLEVQTVHHNKECVSWLLCNSPYKPYATCFLLRPMPLEFSTD